MLLCKGAFDAPFKNCEDQLSLILIFLCHCLLFLQRKITIKLMIFLCQIDLTKKNDYKKFLHGYLKEN